MPCDLVFGSIGPELHGGVLDFWGPVLLVCHLVLLLAPAVIWV